MWFLRRAAWHQLHVPKHCPPVKEEREGRGTEKGKKGGKREWEKGTIEGNGQVKKGALGLAPSLTKERENTTVGHVDMKQPPCVSVERDQDDPKTHSLNNSLGDGQEAIIGLVGRMAWFKYPNKHLSELILDGCPPTQPTTDTVTADRYAK